MMGQCGCGDNGPDEAYELPSGVVVATELYQGCPDCHQGPALTVSVFDNKESVFLNGMEPEPFTPDECGGNVTAQKNNLRFPGINIGVFEVEDMKLAVEQHMDVDPNMSLEEFFDDSRLVVQIIQDAMRLYRNRRNK
jgi:hypothetical protein